MWQILLENIFPIITGIVAFVTAKYIRAKKPSINQDNLEDLLYNDSPEIAELFQNIFRIYRLNQYYTNKNEDRRHLKSYFNLAIMQNKERDDLLTEAFDLLSDYNMESRLRIVERNDFKVKIEDLTAQIKKIKK